MSMCRLTGLTAWAGLACALWVLAGCKGPDKAPAPPRAVNVVVVAAGEGATGTGYTGDVRARFEAPVGFRVGGKITERLVDIGTVVRQGQILARLDPADLRLGVDAARQTLAAAEASHAQSRADYARFAELFRQGFISAAEHDRRKMALDVAAAQLEQARSQWALNTNQAEYSVLRAPNDSVVTAVMGEVGQVVDRGQAVFRLARPGQKEVAINVPENRLAEIRRAGEVSVSLWARPEQRYTGRVREIAPSADPLTRTYAVRVAITDADDAVDLGMTAAVAIATPGRSGSVRIPATALFQKGESPAVWVVDGASSTVRLRPVQVGAFGDGFVVVTAGLNPGETIVRAGVQKLFADEKVRVLAARAP